jgi:enamine deaminase RidA (YjgF/YER057c/UK114 family)
MSALEYLGNPPIASDHLPRPFSPAVRAGDFVYVSGQVPGDEKGEIVQGGIEVQTRQVMKNVQAAGPGRLHAGRCLQNDGMAAGCA